MGGYIFDFFGYSQTMNQFTIGGRSESAGGSGLTRGLIVIRLR